MEVALGGSLCFTLQSNTDLDFEQLAADLQSENFTNISVCFAYKKNFVSFYVVSQTCLLCLFLLFGPRQLAHLFS